MAGETEDKPSGLTVDTLRLLIDARIHEADRRYEQRFKALEQTITTALAGLHDATSKADAASEKRFESVNEFRQTLTDQASRFVTRNEADVQHAALAARIEEATKKIDDLALRFNQIVGRGAGMSDARGITIAVVGILIAIAAVAMSIIVAVSR